MPAASPVRSPTRSASSPKPASPVATPHRPVTGSLLDLIDQDPAYHYVWAYKGDQATGVDYYLNIGYEPVLWTKGGARPRGREGVERTEIERMGHVLVRISKERRDEIEMYGLDGRGGINAVRERQLRIVKQANNLLRDIPGLRGRDGDAVLSVGNQTSELTELEVEE